MAEPAMMQDRWMIMNRLLLVATLASAMAGCASCGGPSVLPAISLEAAELELKEGRIEQGLARFADIWKEAATRSDWAASLTRARILLRCHEVGAVEARRRLSAEGKAATEALSVPLESDGLLLSMAAEQWQAVLTGNSDQPAQMEAAQAMARIMKLKLERPEFRRGTLPADDASEPLYRRLMLECLADFQRYALGRSPVQGRNPAPLAETLVALAAANEALADMPNVNRATAAALRKGADRWATEAADVRRQPEKVVPKPDTYDFVEAEAKRHVEDAGLAAELAQAEISKAEGDASRIVVACGSALRRYLFVIETSGAASAQAGTSQEALRFWFPKFVEWARKR
jgi:hypothetical protein